MKAPRFAVKLLKKKIVWQNHKKYKDTVFEKKYLPNRNIPYLDDDNDYHCFDLYHAEKNNAKGALLIDIHGGSYIFGHRSENYPFGTQFLQEGYDFITIDYVPNGDGQNVKDIVHQCILCITYIINHLEEYGFSKDYPIYFTGDSAGGHLALVITELFNDKEYARSLGYELPNINLKAVLINCPVFNYTDIGDGLLTKKAAKYMFGNEEGIDKEKRKLICPRIHLNSLSSPLFLSTCKNDFLRKSESLLLDKCMQAYYPDHKYVFIDLPSEEKEVSHVHNILDLNHPESVKINKAMVAFMDELL